LTRSDVLARQGGVTGLEETRIEARGR
jgi:hypothetical protein